MNIIGRKDELNTLRDCLESKKPEFLLVYGRRRVGKTYLIKQFFSDRFSFYATGVPETNTRGQLRAFNESLIEYGADEKSIPKDWLEAFRRLKALLQKDDIYRAPATSKRVIFLDELPWMSTARSDFKMALDLFWNSWASSQPDLLLIVCGSAASWIIDNILMDTGGLYNRITRQIHLLPFSLSECEKLLSVGDGSITKKQVMDYYMVFGGIPYYINMFDHRLSVAQNIDRLLFKENGLLDKEYEMLFRSLFRKSEKHINVIEAIGKKKDGVLREELNQDSHLPSGETLTKVLRELEQCGFIRKYHDYKTSEQRFVFQIIDPFVLFSQMIRNNRNITSWVEYVNSPSYNSWKGNAFEILCLNHVCQIKKALGISGISSNEYAWRSRKQKPGAQIDLLIDRKDDIINICEIKYSDSEYTIDEAYSKELVNKMEVFRNETETKKALHITMITANGLKHNSYWNMVVNEITADELFE